MSELTLNTRLQAAIGYANKGWPVFPLYWINSRGGCSCGARNCASPGKHPLIEGGHKNATTDVTVLEKYWEKWPEANIGIRTGEAAGVFVLDVDPANGGEASLKEIETLNSPLPKSLESNTGGGGKHFYFQYPKDRSVIKNRIGFKAGLDIRGEGGYVVATPSNHFSGNSYSWHSGVNPEMIEIAEAPKWLIELIIHKDDKTPRSSSKRQTSINQIPKGKRNSVLASLGGTLRRGGCEYDAILAALQLENERRCEPPLTEFEVEKIAKSISRYLPEDKSSSGSSSAISPVDLAEEFLEDQGFRVSGGLTLREYKGEFYRWIGTHYELFSEGDMSSQVIRWLQQNPFVRSKAGNRLKSEILANLRAMANVRSDVNPPVNLAKIDSPVQDHIFLKNGVLDLKKWIKQDQGLLVPHSPDLFVLGSLPYAFDSRATCPQWSKFLNQAQPDELVRGLIQEWFGYNLIFDNAQEKFALFEGEGANGKTVCCLVLRLLLGEGNVSAVGLEAFNPTRTFPLAATMGKLANVVEELNEIDKAAEGLLKQFVSGGLITIERKNKDAFNFNPTARLTFATNILPRFTDRSSGVWRRMLLVPFRNQILEESKQDKRLVDPTFWKNSGELPGIFNWALEGLKRLKERGRFEEPQVCKDAKGVYKLEMNPARQFLLDYCSFTPGSQLSSRTLYQNYREYAELNGQRPFAEPGFAKEVKRVFPGVALSANPQRHDDGHRARSWSHIVINGKLSTDSLDYS